MTNKKRNSIVILSSAIMLTSVIIFMNMPQASAETVTLRFTNQVIGVNVYTEAGVTITNLSTNCGPLGCHMHIGDGRRGQLQAHFGQSQIYQFTFGGLPFTLVSIDGSTQRNGFCGNNTFISSKGSAQSIGPGRITFGSGFEAITSFTWFTSCQGTIDNVVIKLSVPVEVDIKPGSFPSSVDCAETKPVPVAVFSTPTFDATTIIPTSLKLNGVATPEIHDKVHKEDKNGDGIKDAVLHLDRAQVCVAAQGLPLNESGDLTLIGQTTVGQPFEGTSDIRIVGPEIDPVKGEFCHLGETKSGSPDAVAEHLSHGDIEGPCP